MNVSFRGVVDWIKGERKKYLFRTDKYESRETSVLAITRGAIRLVVTSGTMPFVLVLEASLKKPISIFPDMMRTASRSG